MKIESEVPWIYFANPSRLCCLLSWASQGSPGVADHPHLQHHPSLALREWRAVLVQPARTLPYPQAVLAVVSLRSCLIGKAQYVVLHLVIGVVLDLL
jgi:hypothetical protein